MDFQALSPVESPRARHRLTAIGVLALLVGTALTGCLDQQGGGDEEAQTIVIGVPGGWVGEELRSHMVAHILEEELGYQVEMRTDLEAGPIYQSLSTGDVDVYVGGWLPLQQTHFDAQPEGSIIILGQNLPPEGVTIGLSVPKYVHDAGVTSMADLDEHRDRFNGEITGIEPGAGMMITAQQRMDEWGIYGFDDWTLVESSTAAMLAAYGDAVGAGDWIVVTSWRPHYMYAAWDGEQQMVDLEDPGQEIDGETRYLYKDVSEETTINTLAPDEFPDQFPEAASFLENFQIPVEDENEMMLRVEEGEDAREIALNYLDQNPELVQDWLGN